MFVAASCQEWTARRSQIGDRYLISFPEGAMTFPDKELPDVAEASHAVVRAWMASGVAAVAAASSSPSDWSPSAANP